MVLSTYPVLARLLWFLLWRRLIGEKAVGSGTKRDCMHEALDICADERFPLDALLNVGTVSLRLKKMAHLLNLSGVSQFNILKACSRAHLCS